MNHDMHASMNHSFHFLGISMLGWGAIFLFAVIGFYFSLVPARSTSSRRIDLLAWKPLSSMVKSKYFSFAFRLVPALLFVLVIATGLWGREKANIAAPFTWLFWWTLLIFFVAFGGKIFCAACPWDFFANLFQFGWIHPIRGKIQSLNLKWPKFLANTYIAIAFFVIFTWLELGLELTNDSFGTAVLGLSIAGLAVVVALVFNKRAFCRYACPIGRISGMYSQFSPLELRVRDSDVCRTCRTKDCVKGGEFSTPCPMGETPFRLQQNTYCTLCTECVRSCEKNNLTLKLRPPGADLGNVNTWRKDESLLIFVILVLTFFHGLTMTSTWFQWTDWMEGQLGASYVWAFSMVMFLVLSFSVLILFAFDRLMSATLSTNAVTMKMAYAFIPLVLGYHIGHNAMHVFGELPYLVPLINDPFGWGWNLFGWQGYQPSAILNHKSTQILQLLAIAVGFYYSVKILKIRSHRMKNEGSNINVLKLFIGHYVMLLLIAFLGVWFVFQPMVMRLNY